MSEPVELVEALSYRLRDRLDSCHWHGTKRGKMHTSGEHLHDGEVVRRTLQLMRTIEGFKGKWFGITMVAKQTGLPKGTIHRYLAIFVTEGILERHLHRPQYREKEEE